MPKGSVQTLVLVMLGVCLPGCGVDRETLATPTRYLDSSIPSIELPLFANPDFEEAEDGRPAHWLARDYPHLVIATEEVSFSGSHALCILPGGNVCLVEQSIEIEPGEFGGRIVTASAQVKAGKGRWAALNLTLEGFETFYSEPHPLDNEWHEVTVSAVVPRHWVGTKIALALYGRAPQAPYYFDNVRLCVK